VEGYVLIGECSLPLRYGAITARAYEQSHALDSWLV
jgi:hypothetical protein